jgi:hypothetical protein
MLWDTVVFKDTLRLCACLYEVMSMRFAMPITMAFLKLFKQVMSFYYCCYIFMVLTIPMSKENNIKELFCRHISRGQKKKGQKKRGTFRSYCRLDCSNHVDHTSYSLLCSKSIRVVFSIFLCCFNLVKCLLLLQHNFYYQLERLLMGQPIIYQSHRTPNFFLLLHKINFCAFFV